MSKENVGKFWEWYRQHQEITKKLADLEKKGEGAVTKGLTKIGAEMGLHFTEEDLKAVMANSGKDEGDLSEELEGVAGGGGGRKCGLTCPKHRTKSKA